MNKKGDIAIEEIINLLKYLAIAVVIILIIIFLGKYLFNDIDLTNIFRLK